MVQTTEQAGVVPHLGHLEAERLRHHYLGPEHLLLGLLSQDEDPVPHGDHPAARLLRRHGLDLATVRAEIDRLIAAGVLPGPQPSDAELLASLGIDLDAVDRRIKENFGWSAYYDAAQWVRLRSSHAFPHAPLGGTPLVCWRALRLAAEEAAARDQQLGPDTCRSGCSATPRNHSIRPLPPMIGGCGACWACATAVPTRSGCWCRHEGSPLRVCLQPRSGTSTKPTDPDALTYRGTDFLILTVA